jgi:tRNA (mo5U34)-methyltransferase
MAVRPPMTDSRPATAPDPMLRIKHAASAFKQRLDAIRARTMPANGSPWYPWGTLDNVGALDLVLRGPNRALFDGLEGKAIADIGGADGDLGFFLHSLGASVDIIDNPPTNMNGLDGARRLKAELGSPVEIHSIDLDSQFSLPRRYDFVLFLGILYHLKNPFFVLEQLARHVHHMVLSTRITAFSAPLGDPARARLNGALAYLLAPAECNNDATNYWIFTDLGLRRLLQRSGWDVVDYTILGGDMETSDPASQQGDRRAFCYLQSRHV